MRLARTTFGSAAFVLLAGAMFAAAVRADDSVRGILPTPGVETMRSLEQNWSHDEADWFYSVPQGSRILPYSWFVQLEQPDSTDKFLAAAHLQKFGLLARRADAGRNPGGLPVGFAKDANIDAVGLTCAACHTNQINYEGTALIVDGAPSLMDVSAFLSELGRALQATLDDPQKFSRFSNAVLSNPTSQAQALLRLRLREVVAAREGYNLRNLPADQADAFGHGRIDAFGAILNEVLVRFIDDPSNHEPADAPVSYPFLWDTPQHDFVQWNGAAGNDRNVFLKRIIGTSDFGALGRNVGEVLGVFGDADVSRTFGVLNGHASSVDRGHLIEIEESLRSLWSPEWPEELPELNSDLVDAGRDIFQDHCSRCHLDIARDDPERTVKAQMWAVGTDDRMARNFAVRVANTGPLAGRRQSLLGLARLGEEASGAEILAHVVQRVVVGPAGAEAAEQDAAGDAQLAETIGPPAGQPPAANVAQTLGSAVGSWQLRINAEVAVGNRTVSGAFESIRLEDDRVTALQGGKRVVVSEGDARQPVESSPEEGLILPKEESATDLKEVVRELGVTSDAEGVSLRDVGEATVRFQYKARPLNGIWATAPYLHNGSVPTLEQLLKKASDRSPKFFVGEREFLPDEVGFVYDRGPSEYDTTKRGNSNAGHEFGVNLSDDQRRQLLEYLKSI